MTIRSVVEKWVFDNRVELDVLSDSVLSDLIKALEDEVKRTVNKRIKGMPFAKDGWEIDDRAIASIELKSFEKRLIGKEAK